MKKRILACILAIALMLSLVACNNAKNGETESQIFNKGDIKNPYSLSDSFQITAYDVVPYTAYMPEGRQVENPIKFEISNIKLLEQQSYSSYEGGKEVTHDNYYLVSFDLEVLESSTTDAVTFNYDYLSLRNLNSTWQIGNSILGEDAETPAGYIYFGWQTLVPMEGAKWNFADVIQTESNGDLSCIVFNYCGEDGEYHDIYVSVERKLQE